MIECTTLKFKYEIPSILDVEIVYNITIFTMFYRIVFNFVLFSPGYLVLLTKTCSVVTFQCRRGETSNDHDFVHFLLSKHIIKNENLHRH